MGSSPIVSTQRDQDFCPWSRPSQRPLQGICTRNTPLLVGVLHDATPRWRLREIVGELRECFGEGLVPVPSGVLIDERSMRARVAHAGDEFLGAGTGRCGERGPRVTEVVEAEVTNAHRFARRLPDATIEVAPAKWRAVRRGEDEILLALLDVRSSGVERARA